MVGAEGSVGAPAASTTPSDGARAPIVVLLGARRAGKSSICKVVYESYQPNDTLFLAPTMRTQKLDIHTFQPLQLWDVPGSALMSFSNTVPRGTEQAPGRAHLDIPWPNVCTVIFVIDAQDDYFEAVTKLNQVVVHAHENNKAIQFHVFINKVDGLSEDYKYDTQRDIEQRVMEGLIDSSNELQDTRGEPIELDQQVNIKFYLTSIFDSSVFVAFSRIQQQLLQGLYDPSVAPQQGRMVSLTEALETACDLLCSTCQFEKAYVFDVPSRTFVACDTSPFDLALFDVMFQYIRFLSQFTGLYQMASESQHNDVDLSKYARTWSTSVVQLTSDTTVLFWQLDCHLGLLTVTQAQVQANNASILDYNVDLFRRAMAHLVALL
ncbi:GTP-binding protein gtr2 [Malassezia nana]|uniref:GTP-binding protein n=1 Tax=Malassezia nana TaxID=180528 RepID=A0AAF0J271_9BASI|nr:GTP-binding protein gtr2 [Malassezia nana]